ncbi:MAG: glycosyltransferase family 2 protein [Candidatus Saccharimonadales bacterium]
MKNETKSMIKPVVVVPNWNDVDSLSTCLDSLINQSVKPQVIVVDNGSIDGSVDMVEKKYPEVELLKHEDNKGFSGGVNAGFRSAIEFGDSFVATLNNDAVADRHWLESLVKYLDSNESVGVATCKLLSGDGEHIDSTGDYYTSWGLPYPRGRGEKNIHKYDEQIEVFGASGGASLYRVSMLKDIGLFDESFFAYYEDVDLSFRAQLAGWKVAYVPEAVAYHQIGATSSKIKGFTTYQTIKNLPLLLIKNLPSEYLWKVGPRFILAHSMFFGRAVLRGQGWFALKGFVMLIVLLPNALVHRNRIQSTKKVSDGYIWSILVHDLPPNAHALRKLRSKYRKHFGK